LVIVAQQSECEMRLRDRQARRTNQAITKMTMTAITIPGSLFGTISY
jgi:hypothetical protein